MHRPLGRQHNLQVGGAGMPGPTLPVFFQPGDQFHAFQIRQLRFPVRTREEQQHFYQVTQLLCLAVHECEHALVFIGRARPPQAHFDLAKHGCQRCAQLMRSIAGEAPLALKSFLQPIEQLVERGAEIFKLIARTRIEQALVHIRGFHGAGCYRHARHWNERPPAEPPSHERRQRPQSG